jgi:hypothetical protein
VLRSCSVAAAVRAAAQVLSPGSRNGWPSGPDAAAPARLAAQRVVAGRRQVRTPATPVVALSASSVRRADVRPIGRADVWCPRVRCPRDRFHLGVRTDRPPVSAALQPRCLCRAGPWYGSVERAAPLGAAGSTCRRGPLAAWSPARIRSDGKGCCCVARAWLARGFDGSPGRRFAGAPAARHHAAGPTRALVQRQGAVRLVGEHETEQVLTSSPQARPGQVAGVGSTMGLDEGGGDHAAWSLGW